ncbi:MAG: nucleoside-diphosphate sugar epimerase/dehydratase, partial [Clostridia bacterium]|nr:nucleoside-diphosphate sugar epimerase/dehydratase [Clostridia bacterium]
MKIFIRKITVLGIDILLLIASVFLSFFLRFDTNFSYAYQAFNRQFADILPVYVLLFIAVYLFFGLYKSLWSYASVNEVFSIVLANTFAIFAFVALLFFVNDNVPRSIIVLLWIFNNLLISAFRMSYRVIRHMGTDIAFNNHDGERTLIIGAGDAGCMVVKELRKHNELNMNPVAFIDDDKDKTGKYLLGIPVVGDRTRIEKTVKEEDIKQVVIAMPSVKGSNIREVVDICKRTRCKLKILPGVFELLNGTVTASQLRDVQIEDLLGREQVQLDIESICDDLEDRVVLVTGGGGSIGSELCRQIAKFEPRRLLILDIYENSVYDLQNELARKHPYLKMDVLIASVRDKARLDGIFRRYKPDVVFHAAAHKHVPLMEGNPTEAIKNNVFGTMNVAEAADKYHTKKFVLISTDKAVNPTNIMGATKRVAEMIIQSMDKHSKTVFSAVRFGNVLGSNGSVVPLFRKQIEQGGPVTVTHPEVTRFFMTIPEAVQLVLQAGSMAKGGDIFVLDMGEPVKIDDLARDLIKLSGLEPDKDIKIEYVGLRPGEKLYEEILMDEEGLTATKHEKIYIGKPIFSDINQLRQELEKLKFYLLGSEDKLIKFME